MFKSINLKVFGFFRMCEAFISVICFCVHVFKIIKLNDEFFQYEIIFRIAHLGFMIFSILSAIKHAKGFLNLYFEAASGCFGFVFYIFSSTWSMAVIENDVHLENFSENQENEHRFFQVNRFLSVISLIGGMLFLLHATFVIDLINSKFSSENSAVRFLPRFSNSSNQSDNHQNELKLVFFPEVAYEKCFQK